MAAANARIGIAQAAYFRRSTSTRASGSPAAALSNLFTLPNRTWSLGAALAGTLSTSAPRRRGERRRKRLRRRPSPTTARPCSRPFQEVESNLATLHWLAEESKVQVEATRAARESVALTTNQYKAGTQSYLAVVIVEASRLSEERSMVTLINRRLAATVALVRALGGTW
jgi:outer membrane protein TolC